jgi:hypothetical protein
MGFAEDLEAVKTAGRRTDVVPIQLNGKRYKLKFTQMIGSEYAAETLRHPPRMEIPIDREFGYNLSSLSEAIAPKCGVLLDGKEEIELTNEQWADIFASDGGTAQEIVNSIFSLNQTATAKGLQQLKKALDGSPLN